MTALSDIRFAIEHTILLVATELGQPVSPAAGRFMRHERLRVKLGDAAAQSIVAELAVSGRMSGVPKEIDDVPIERTRDFPGFEVVIL